MPTGVRCIWNTDEVRALIKAVGREEAVAIISGNQFKREYVEDMVRQIISPLADKEFTTFGGIGNLNV